MMVVKKLVRDQPFYSSSTIDLRQLHQLRLPIRLDRRAHRVILSRTGGIFVMTLRRRKALLVDLAGDAPLSGLRH